MKTTLVDFAQLFVLDLRIYLLLLLVGKLVSTEQKQMGTIDFYDVTPQRKQTS